MTKRPLEYRVRQITIIIMFIGAVIAIITGIIMYMRGVDARGGADPFRLSIATIHAWAGFIAAGMLIIHLYLNRRPLVRYIKGLFS
ncbi:MAG: DUF4405 domain-containing protein [Euryarchaeota archaeon]|nr:DUF4405 domain-containing protein [Euryarchaeota archaeon]